MNIGNQKEEKFGDQIMSIVLGIFNVRLVEFLCNKDMIQVIGYRI